MAEFWQIVAAWHPFWQWLFLLFMLACSFNLAGRVIMAICCFIETVGVLVRGYNPYYTEVQYTEPESRNGEVQAR